MLRAKGLGPGEKINSFEPVCLTLAVVTVDDIQPWAPFDSPTKVAKVRRFNRSEQHVRILADSLSLAGSSSEVILDM
jgi:hypothetical protein